MALCSLLVWRNKEARKFVLGGLTARFDPHGCTVMYPVHDRAVQYRLNATMSTRQNSLAEKS